MKDRKEIVEFLEKNGGSFSQDGITISLKEDGDKKDALDFRVDEVNFVLWNHQDDFSQIYCSDSVALFTLEKIVLATQKLIAWFNKQGAEIPLPSFGDQVLVFHRADESTDSEEAICDETCARDPKESPEFLLGKVTAYEDIFKKQEIVIKN